MNNSLDNAKFWVRLKILHAVSTGFDSWWEHILDFEIYNYPNIMWKSPIGHSSSTS